MTFLYTIMLGNSSSVIQPLSMASDFEVGMDDGSADVPHWFEDSLDDMLTEAKKEKIAKKSKENDFRTTSGRIRYFYV